MLSLDIYLGKESGVVRVADNKVDMVNYLSDLTYDSHMELFVKQNENVKYYVNRADDYVKLCDIYGVDAKVNDLAW